MHQHLKQGLVTDALASRDLSRLRNVGLRQPQSYLNGGGAPQLLDKVRSLRPASLVTGPVEFCFTNSRPWGLAHQSASSPSFANIGISIGFFFIRITLQVPAGSGSPSSARNPDDESCCPVGGLNSR